MDLNGETLQKWCRNDVQPDPKSMDWNGETLQKWCRNDVEPDPKSMDLNGETLHKWCRNDVQPDPKSMDSNGGRLQKWCRNDVSCGQVVPDIPPSLPARASEAEEVSLFPVKGASLRGAARRGCTEQGEERKLFLLKGAEPAERPF